MELKQEQITIGDDQFIQKGEYKEILEVGCYHNLQKPAAD